MRVPPEFFPCTPRHKIAPFSKVQLAPELAPASKCNSRPKSQGNSNVSVGIRCKPNYRIIPFAYGHQCSRFLSKDDKKFLRRICKEPTFIDRLAFVLASAEAAITFPRRFLLEEHKNYLANLERSAQRLLTLLELKATSQGINLSAADAILGRTLPEAEAQAWKQFRATGDRTNLPAMLHAAVPSRIEGWRQSIRQLLSHIPHARECERARYRWSRKDALLWSIVEELEHVFKHYGLPVAGRESKFEQCLAIILETAGRPMKEEALRRMVIKARKTFRKFPSQSFPSSK